MHIDALDLNLLRLFDAVHRTGNVSRAAELLHLTQPAASQGLSRLRALLGDPLFVRAAGGMAPTPRADRMAGMVRSALATLEQAVGESARFDPAQSRRVFRLHLSDIGEARFLPALMAAMRARAPGVHIETEPVPPAEQAAALDSGRIDLAIGFLPRLQDGVQSVPLLNDRYVVLLRAGHPFARQRRRSAAALLQDLRTLDFVAVRSHADTLRILQMAQLDGRVRLTTEHFMVLPSIVRATDLAVVMPRNIARGFAEAGGYAIVEPAFALRDFSVALHWSHRFDAEPGNAWLRALVVELFQEPAAAAGRSAPG